MFFTSPDALTPQALADQVDALNEQVPNIYEYRAGHVYLISDGRDASIVFENPGVRLVGSDLTGSDVFFTTSDPLIGQDTDTEQDVYDAHVNGGFSGPVEPPGCIGEGCHGALGPTPALQAPGSRTQVAEVGTSAAPDTSAKQKTKTRKKTKNIKKKHGRRASKADRRHAHGRARR